MRTGSVKLENVPAADGCSHVRRAEILGSFMKSPHWIHNNKCITNIICYSYILAVSQFTLTYLNNNIKKMGTKAVNTLHGLRVKQ